LLTAGLSHKIQQWDVADNSLITTIDDPAFGFVNGVRFGPSDGDAAFMATTFETVAHVWKNNGDVLDLEGHASQVVRGAFSPDGRFIATAPIVGHAVLWNSDGTTVKVLEDDQRGINGVHFSPDSRWLVTAGLDGAITLWRTEDGSRYKTFMGHGGAVMQAVFSRDGTMIISCSTDETVKIWKNLRLPFDTLMDMGRTWLADYYRLDANSATSEDTPLDSANKRSPQ